MTVFNTTRNFSKDLGHIRNLTSKIDKKLKEKSTPEQKINGLSFEELNDLSKIVKLADFMLCKYEDKKDMQSILTDFVSMIKESAEDITGIDDEISELILSAEDSIKKVKDVHSRLHKRTGMENEDDSHKIDQILAETSSINLTKFTTDINTVEYQQNSEEESGQVI
ncbi:MAG: hypothetical protein R3327_08750 [Nitrosopumilaceae archaeon]|nr:hypothetical protein [Nitrosopumilaceae archaeon]